MYKFKYPTGVFFYPIIAIEHFLCFFEDFVYLFERERESTCACASRGRGRGERENLKQTPDHDLSQNQESNQLSHPGAPENFLYLMGAI